MSARQCDTCRHRGTLSTTSPGPRNPETIEPQGISLALEYCTSPKVKDELRSFGYGITKGYEPDLETGREFCDREGDGVFVYYEPLDETARGRTFDAADAEVPAAPPDLVQITREPLSMAARA